jgi:hypothetical protein
MLSSCTYPQSVKNGMDQDDLRPPPKLNIMDHHYPIKYYAAEVYIFRDSNQENSSTA